MKSSCWEEARRGRGALPPAAWEDGRGDGVPLRHLAVPGSWWEGNQGGKYKGHLSINWLLTLWVTLLNEIVS